MPVHEMEPPSFAAPSTPRRVSPVPGVRMRQGASACSALLLAVLTVLAWPGALPASRARTVVDAAGTTVNLPHEIGRAICSGSGCLRLLTYLQAQDRVVAVDSIEKRCTMFDARPYALANPQFKNLPLFGEFRGFDRPELIAALEEQPQVIFKTFWTSGHDPGMLRSRTGIPVVALNHGDLGDRREDLFSSLRLMGEVMGKKQRAEEVIAFIEGAIRDLDRRTADIPGDRLRSCFVGGIAYRGPHGLQSTEPGYPPFAFTHAANVASPANRGMEHVTVAKEQIVQWDPEVIFLDLSTTQGGDAAGALFELKTDPAYQSLSAAKTGEVYGVLPYNWYSQNLGSILADAYFVGKVLYPWRFEDIDPAKKADEIYAFLVGKKVFSEMSAAFGGLAFERIPLE